MRTTPSFGIRILWLRVYSGFLVIGAASDPMFDTTLYWYWGLPA